MDNFHRIVQAGEQRNHSRYTWLRYLVGLSAGLFSALFAVFVSNLDKFAPQVYMLLKTALMSNAVALLFGTVALYGEVSTADRLLRALVMSYTGNAQEKNVASYHGKIVVPLSPIYSFCEKASYAFLVIAFGCLTVLVWFL